MLYRSLLWRCSPDYMWGLAIYSHVKALAWSQHFPLRGEGRVHGTCLTRTNPGCCHILRIFYLFSSLFRQCGIIFSLYFFGKQSLPLLRGKTTMKSFTWCLIPILLIDVMEIFSNLSYRSLVDIGADRRGSSYIVLWHQSSLRIMKLSYRISLLPFVMFSFYLQCSIPPVKLWKWI